MNAESPFPFETKLESPMFKKADDVYKETQAHPNWSSSTADCERNSLPQDLTVDDPFEMEHSKLPGYAMKDEDTRPSNSSSHRILSPRRSVIDDNASISLDTSTNKALRKDAPVTGLMDEPLYENRNSDNFFDSRSHHGQNIPSRGWSSPNRRNTSRSRSRNRSTSRGRSRSRSWSRGRSRSRSRSRSWNRGRSRSRSRSPIGVRHKSDRWADRWADRRSAGPAQAQACRDFSAGRCRRGNQCCFRHDDRYLQDYNRHHDSRESRFDRERYQGYGNKGKLNTPSNHNDFSHKPLRRYGAIHGDDDLKESEIHRNHKSIEICFDFTKGRCQRGSNCRYIHHEASSGRWRSKDDSKEQFDDRGDDARHKLEPHRVSDTPCIFFAEGRCRNGKKCKFSHKETPAAVGPQDDQWGYNEGISEGSTGNALKQNARTNLIDTGGNEPPASLFTGKAESCIQGSPLPLPERADKSEYQNLSQGNYQKVSTSQVQNTSQEIPLPNLYSSTNLVFHGSGPISLYGDGNLVFNSSENQSEMNSANIMPRMDPVPAQGFVQNDQNQFHVPHLLHGQIPGPNMQIPQVSPLPFCGQMPEMVYQMPPVGQNQPVSLLTPSNLQNTLPSQPFVPAGNIGQNLQNSNTGSQIQQNPPFLPNEQGQGKLNVSGHNLLGQNQLDVNPGRQIALNIVPGVQNQHNFNLSQSEQNPENAQSHVGDGQNQHVLDNAATDLQGLKSEVDLKSTELAVQEGSQPKFNILEVKPTPATPTPASPTSDTIISNKVVTSEQAVKITDLSVSLAQFFGSAAMHASASVFPSSQSLINPSSVVLPAPAVLSSVVQGPMLDSFLPVADPRIMVSQLTDPRIKGSQVKSKSLNQSYDNDTAKELKHENTNEQDAGSPTMKASGTETGGKVKKEEKLHSEDDEDERADGNIKKNKDAKAVKMFKCSLVDFVKDILKPIWKEGQLSKESHKIIVKKVVDKVSGAMSASNIPSTQEKIDSYLAHSKPKLGKLIQAYVEKYGKT